MYFLKTISDDVRFARVKFKKHTRMMKLIFGAIFACMAAVLQSAGGFLPVIGYFISPLATAPVLLCSMFSFSIGVMTYFLTILLLLIMQPAELFVFPFTTGLLGVGIGTSFYLLGKRFSIIVAGAILLTMGIIFLLLVIGFPIFGPLVTGTISGTISFLTIGGILVFSFFYSWLWVEIALIIFNRIRSFVMK
ncbi:hypothetical protein [Pseudoneobacillus sp. C159]